MAISRDSGDYPSSLFRPGKIAVPVVARSRLLSRIVGPDARKVTLLAAPIGYGKTVLLTQAFEAFIEEGRRCLWLSLNDELGDGTLLDLVWAAAERAGIPAAAGAASSVNNLLNRIERCPEPVCIIIDCLDPTIPTSTDALLQRLIHGTPQNTSVLIATETALHLSVVRLEASGLLRKIAASELAFDDNDLAALGRLTALPGWIPMLNRRVEGWPAIIQLALSRSRETSDPAPPLLTGCQHDIAVFLDQEVLRNLQAHELARLSDAAIVEEICGPLLDALSGGGDGSAVLSKLMALGVPMRDAGRRGWFRLHRFLRDHLQERMLRQQGERLTILHRHAALWLLSCGDETAALSHATATGNLDFLRSIYQRLTVAQAPLQNHDEMPMAIGDSLGNSSKTTSDPAWRTVFDLISRGQLDAARTSITQARCKEPSALGTELSDIRPLEWEAVYSDLLLRAFDDRLPRPDQLEALRERLMRAPGVPPSIPAAVSELIIVSRFRRGDLSGMTDAEQNLWHTRALAPTQSKIYVLLELGIAALELGDLELAVRHFRHAQTRAIETHGPEASLAHAASILLAEVALERGDRITSAQLLEQSLPHVKHQEIWFNLAASAFTTLSAEAAHRSWGDAIQALDAPQSLSNHVGLWRLPAVLVAQRLRLACLWSEDLEAAREDRATLSGLGLLDLGELDSAGFGWRVSVPAQLAVIRFDLADGNPDAALARSLALRPILETRGHVRRLIELDLLQGRAAIQMGDQASGQRLVRAALESSVRSGLTQCFLDESRFLDTHLYELYLASNLSPEQRAFLDGLMVKLARPLARSTRYVANGRTFDLSSREAQLLRALVSGKTFKEISFALNISVNTTKMHRTRLYRKLGCNSRSHAIALAHALVAT